MIGGIGDDHFFSNNADEETDGRKMRKYNDPSRDGGVNFEIFPGDKVLIAGTSGNGKSSLLRAISGLWELGSGRVTWNTNLDLCSLSGVGGGSSVGSDYSGNKAPQGVFFLPQKPYNLLGSLRQQIAYPSISPGDDPGVAVVAGIEIGIGIGIETGIKDQTGSSSNSNLMQSDNRSNLDKNIMFTQKNRSDSDSELLAILTIVKLGTLASRMGSGDEEVGLGVCKDWTKVLSLGEQQRLAFARVLYNRKNISVVVLDEATSALDESSEAAMYSLLSDLKVTYLSVGHRASLYKFHSRKITLNGPGREVACIPIPQTVTTVSDREREGKRDRQAD